MKRILIITTLLAMLALTSCTKEQNSVESTLFRPNENNKQEDATKFSFIVTGDNDSLNDVYKEIIKQTNESDAKFLVHVGDITNGSSEYKFQEFKEYMDQNMKKPYYISIGDNDILQDIGKEGFKNYFGDTYYSFDFENSHFVILDNADNQDRFGDEQLAWLDEDLVKNKRPNVFLFMHRPINPPFAQMFDYDQDQDTKDKNQRFLDIIKKYKVSEIYSGHIHSYIEYSPDGQIAGTITGGAGSPFQLNSTGSAEYHFVKVNVDGKKHTNEEIKINKTP